MLGCSCGGTAWTTSIVGGFQATSKGSGNRSWNEHVPVAIWARPTYLPTQVGRLGRRTCIMGGDRQDQGQSCSFPARNNDTWACWAKAGISMPAVEAHRDEGRYRASQAP